MDEENINIVLEKFSKSDNFEGKLDAFLDCEQIKQFVR